MEVRVVSGQHFSRSTGDSWKNEADLHVLLGTLRCHPPRRSWGASGWTPARPFTAACSPQDSPLGPVPTMPVSGLVLLLLAASFISSEKGRKMLPTPVGTHSGTSLLGPSLLDGNSRDSFVSRSLADVAEVSAQPYTRT